MFGLIPWCSESDLILWFLGWDFVMEANVSAFVGKEQCLAEMECMLNLLKTVTVNKVKENLNSPDFRFHNMKGSK